MAEDSDIGDLLEARAQWRLGHLEANTRETLLLHSIEGFSYEQIGPITDVTPAEAEDQVKRAFADIGDMVTGDILIIEDEGIIAMDLKSIASEMGRTVSSVARTRDQTIDMGRAGARPDPCRHPTGRQVIRDRRRERAAERVGRTCGDLHERLPRTSADWRAAGGVD